MILSGHANRSIAPSLKPECRSQSRDVQMSPKIPLNLAVQSPTSSRDIHKLLDECLAFTFGGGQPKGKGSYVRELPCYQVGREGGRWLPRQFTESIWLTVVSVPRCC